METISFLLQFKSVFFKISVAMVLGGIIGWERERHGRPAGFRTHMIVCIGSALFMLVSEQLFIKYQHLNSSSVARIDPARIAAGIVAGIGFLGAGTIMKDGNTVMGLTTASCLWLVAAIGMAIGVGYMIPAFFITIIALIILLALAKIEKAITLQKYRTLKILVKDEGFDFSIVEKTLQKYSIELLKYKFKTDVENGKLYFDMNLKLIGKHDIVKISQELREKLTGLKSLEWN